MRCGTGNWFEDDFGRMDLVMDRYCRGLGKECCSTRCGVYL